MRYSEQDCTLNGAVVCMKHADHCMGVSSRFQQSLGSSEYTIVPSSWNFEKGSPDF